MRIVPNKKNHNELRFILWWQIDAQTSYLVGIFLSLGYLLQVYG